MSFKLGLNRVQEALVLALMLLFVFAVMYSAIDFAYKISITILVFTIIILASLAEQSMKEAEQASQKR